MSHQRGTDQRVQRTRTLLHDALASLVHEKRYDDIAVQEILARAEVGRSTFYAHYRGKHELLEHGIRDLLRIDARSPERWTCATERLLRFSIPFLQHVERCRERGASPMGATAAAALHDHLRRVLETALADELRTELRHRSASRADGVPAELLARHVAGAFVLTLDWWLEHPTRSARDVDAHFRALVVPTLRRTLGDRAPSTAETAR
jgi:AcrR family transcriptional regulator